MQPTRISLIHNLRHGAPDAWATLDSVYRPMIIKWLQRYQLQSSDAEDIAQEVMATVVRRIDDFDHNDRVGAFRSWLRTITVNVSRNFLRKANRQPEATGSSTFREMLDQLQDPESDISREFNLQHDQFVLIGLLKNVSSQFKPETIEAFRLHVLEEVDAKEVAQHLGVKVHAVYMAKSRVLRSLREVAVDATEE